MGEDIALGMGKNIMDGSAFAVSLRVDRVKLPADLYKGKTISVTGEIGARTPPFSGGARVIVTDLSQIVVK